MDEEKREKRDRGREKEEKGKKEGKGAYKI